MFRKTPTNSIVKKKKEKRRENFKNQPEIESFKGKGR